MSDAQGRVTVLEVYRCDHPGCGKLFQTRGAFATHQARTRLRPEGFRTQKSDCCLTALWRCRDGTTGSPGQGTRPSRCTSSTTRRPCL